MNEHCLTFVSISFEIVGQLPLELGNLTELTKVDMANGDLSAGPIPDSLALCTKLVHLELRGNMLEGGFPAGLRGLTSLSIHIY
jgi:hypothetical protein